ncbi:class 1b ribonucleoside-diphosphate reductase subunit alpha [Lentilactobacillus hilgardii]|uniref:Ribonucleoside-diphosphate reductase n=1 Tax=Lentilactobacillus hilgardii (strain ATCC 8290 / DSM 20176 / CCUG 30140 / JCM 1155 / KCTC 3500 / NBRC 15886 / NCIMB 8040 / NRRL B-1843 / 9) TaxID=1423757 RepID=C0XG50_LENH9|nr:class 1b ribonucleoside-diphosphate reductase subunit alpha [Lentilactobacillus hilgardii]EEI18338.1 ribonucleoside-diphosphate reductase, alpha subunit [Lentilactobacillus buchneri ATCC 11577]EEI25636.1 ribonucleoside-diphosphate reductase, alpha subunit [Lentilactobacillus hilgardii DSM 20176 = ATCC 8290]KRK54804.1 ribonucleotide-diphosphate reductase subunit alpha [Lentilactobacillus hilgardii DSM 20176 = ATCC 8290]MCT3396499.1 class 1b ribonucleoside-diphosphate reductase subunit alpha [
MSLHNLKDVTYFDLNNEINIPVDNQIPLQKDQQALQAFLKQNVTPNLMTFDSLQDRFDYLIENHYYEAGFIKKYPISFIEKLYQYLKDQDFHFKSFMAAYKFYAQYALKTNDNDKYLESFLDRVAANALFFADGDEQLAMNLADEIIHQRYQPATPSFLNAGRQNRGEFVSCFLIQSTDDMNTIGRTINSALQLSRIGGGVGINLSNLRAAGDPIKHIEGAASGVVPVMKLLEDSFSYSNQLGQRQGAGVVYLSVFHPDIISFLGAKKENADEKIRLKTLSLGVTVPDKYYELVKADADMYLFSPYDVEREYGVPFSYVDITKEYDHLVANDKIKKTKVKARDLETEISKLQQESGYPYIINIDTANRENPIDGRIVMSNLCSEILQVQTPSTVDNEQHYIKLGKDISCNLGSTNIANMMNATNFGHSVESMVRALTFVTDHSNIDVVPSIQNGNRESHSIGLGAMGLHSYFAKSHMHYGSPESIEFTSVYFMLLNYWSLVASNKIAKERHQTFDNFEKSKYADGTYFDKYLNHSYAPQSDKVKQLFHGITIPTNEDWVALKKAVMEDGLYHQNRLAVAPNGSISYINDTTASLHPIINRIEERQESKIGKIYYPAPYLSNDTMPYYTSAYDMDMRKVIDIYAAAQVHVDQGMALTLFMRSTIPEGLYEWKNGRTDKMTTRDLNILRNYAHRKGIKSIYYIRTFTDDQQEVGSNQCESCVI